MQNFWMIYDIMYNNAMCIQSVHGDDVEVSIAVTYYHCH